VANWVIYDNARLKQMNGSAVNFSSGGSTLKIMLGSSADTPVVATDEFKSNVTGEVSGTNYTPRGSTLASKTLTLSGGTVTFDAADVTFSQSAGGFTNARYAYLYLDTGTDGTSQLVAYADFGADKGNVSGDLVLQMDAAGIFTSP
jgi:hypothetical protein